MKIKKFHIYLTDLNPRFGTEPGKIRPAVVIQTDLINHTHTSTMICPISTSITKNSNILRVFINKKESQLDHDSEILVDQVRSIDNRRFLKQIGVLNIPSQQKLLDNLRILILE